MWRCIGNPVFVVAWCFLSMPCLGQTAPDSTVKKNRTPVWMTAGMDISRPLMPLFSRIQSGWEGSIDFRNSTYLIGANLGFARRRFDQPNYQIEDRGLYGTLGIARSLFPEKGQALAFGLWTGFARFTNQSGNIRVPLYPGPGEKVLDGQLRDHTALWMEFRGLVRTQLYSWLMLGFDIRMRTLLQSPDKALPVYFIPGYGLRKNRLSPGITYSIFVQLPFRTTRAGKADQNLPGESGSPKNPAGR